VHAHEVATDAALVRRLLAAQFPDWAGLPIERVPSAGTDNAIYRLGNDMAARLPRVGWATGQVEREHRWLPRLASHLQLAIPAPLALGTPAEGYPWPWAVYRWLEGETATHDRIADLRQAAIDLARFISALQRIDSTGGPRAGEDRSRGVPLAARDAETRAAIEALHGVLDTEAVTREWQTALRAPMWPGPGVWLHGDLNEGNLLARSGRLSAVIDWGTMAIGDPACDLMAAWTLFTGVSRIAFRESLPFDDATWVRGRGWALSWALIVLPYYQHTNPGLCRIAERTISEVLADAKPRRA
jgi:aminoglycoside phosphotransferase (APT) family kinase protein